MKTPKADWVEINLSYEAFASLPVPYQPDKETLEEYPSFKECEGTLSFEETRVTPETRDIKVLVPPDAVKSKEALEEYIYEEINNDFCERITFRNINIWDEKKEKWVFSFGRS